MMKNKPLAGKIHPVFHGAPSTAQNTRLLACHPQTRTYGFNPGQ